MIEYRFLMEKTLADLFKPSVTVHVTEAVYIQSRSASTRVQT